MRLTERLKSGNYCTQSGDFYDLYNKLGQLEDLMDSYGIDNIKDLNLILAEYFCEIKEHTFKAKR